MRISNATNLKEVEKFLQKNLSLEKSITLSALMYWKLWINYRFSLQIKQQMFGFDNFGEN